MENTHTMIGTQIKQAGMAQENTDSNPASKITLEIKMEQKSYFQVINQLESMQNVD